MQGLLHHIEIYVNDLEKTKKFWGWLLPKLNYEKYQQWNNGISYKLEKTYIVFVQTEKRFQDIPYHRCRAGLNHLAFHGGTREKIDEITKLLRQKNITILYEDKHPYAGGENYYAVYFEDPDRMKVEIVAE